MNQTDKKLLNLLRENSRMTLTNISKRSNTPVSTIFDRMKRLEKTIIKKHITLLDFQKIGYGIKVHYLISTKDKNSIIDYLSKQESINNLHRLTNGSDFHFECIFKDMNEMITFKENLLDHEIKLDHELFTIEEIKREEFIC